MRPLIRDLKLPDKWLPYEERLRRYIWATAKRNTAWEVRHEMWDGQP